MAVQDLMNSLYGSYTPTGVYSFEFKCSDSGIFSDSKKKIEIFFMLPPGNITIGETQKSNILETLGGFHISDYGAGLKDITVNGEINYHHVGSHINPIGNLSDTVFTIDGYSEFKKIEFMVSRYRDYTMTKNGKLIAPSFSLPATVGTQALKKWVSQHGGLAGKVKVIFHDYDLDNHFAVLVSNFQSIQDKNDVFTIKYNIQMKGYERVSGSGTGSSIKQIERKKSTSNQTREAIKLMLAERIDSPADLPLELFEKDNNLAVSLSTLEDAEVAIQTGQSTPQRALV